MILFSKLKNRLLYIKIKKSTVRYVVVNVIHIPIQSLDIIKFVIIIADDLGQLNIDQLILVMIVIIVIMSCRISQIGDFLIALGIYNCCTVCRCRFPAL